MRHAETGYRTDSKKAGKKSLPGRKGNKAVEFRG
jgi:hypothetical protein